MLDVRNKTPFEVGIVPTLDKEGLEHATVVVKATFDLSRPAPEPPVAEAQVPLVHGDVFHGDPQTTSIKHESDDGPTKLATDVVLVGHARAAREVKSMLVSLTAGPLHKSVQVSGDRVWFRSLGSWTLSDPVPFTAMPLTYERAFGGFDQSDADASNHGCEERNPVGTGYCVKARAEYVEGLRLPNLEDPRDPIDSPTDRPAPAGFGFMGRHWLPRRAYAGTYDEQWRQERCPLLPLDFDDRYFNSAHPDLTATGHFQGGEPVRVTGVREQGELVFPIPKRQLVVTTRIKAARANHAPVLDTVIIEPDEQRLMLTYRVTVPCPRAFLLIDYVRVAEEEPG